MNKSIQQNHSTLANRLDRMARVILSDSRSTDEQKKYAHALRQDAVEHRRKSLLFGALFMMKV